MNILKFIVIGECQVGKTSLVKSFNNISFEENYQSTIGVSFSVKKIEIEGKIITIQMWDTAGQELYRSITYNYYRDANWAFIVFDVTNIYSFNSLNNWINDIKKMNLLDCNIAIVANKIDLINREVSTQIAKQFSNQNNIHYFEISAKTGQNIKEMFLGCIYFSLNNLNNNVTTIKNENLSSFKNNNKNCC